MKDKILRFINEQIEDGEVLREQASGKELETIIGAVNAFEEVKEFVEALNEDDEGEEE